MKSFEELYEEFKSDKEILQASKEVVKERKRGNRITLVTCLIVDLIIIMLYIFLNIGITRYTILLYLIPIIFANLIIMIIITIAFSKKQRAFKPIFKEKIIKTMISNFFDSLEYFPNKGMIREIYREGKYESYDNYYSDDYIEARIDDKYYIDMAEVHTEREETYTDSDGDTHTRTYTIFHGLFAKIKIDKSINSNLRITPNSNFSARKDKLEMDSSEFEKKFDVFASNKIIGMQLLTSDIMEEILEFKNKSKDIFDIFINENNIYLRFHCGSMFEVTSLKKGELDRKTLERYYNILKFVYDMANKFIKIINESDI